MIESKIDGWQATILLGFMDNKVNGQFRIGGTENCLMSSIKTRRLATPVSYQ